jgi:aspartyl aminopeptidase
VARDIGVDIEQIIDFEFSAYDFQKPAIIGLHDEFVSSPRLDNLASSLCSLDSIIEFHKKDDKNNSEVSMIMLFDHEEIGSQSASGADSNLVVETIERVLSGTNPAKTDPSREDFYRAIKKSFFISADMAHAIHPNYADKHHPQHMPKVHEGIVLKINCN